MKNMMKKLIFLISILLIGYGSYYYYYEIPKDLNSSELKQIDFKFRLSDDGKFLNGDLFNNTNRTITEVTLSSYAGMFEDLFPNGKKRKYVIKVFITPHRLGHFKQELFDIYFIKAIDKYDIKLIGGKSLP